MQRIDVEADRRSEGTDLHVGEKDNPQGIGIGMGINLPDIFRYGKDNNQTIDRR